MFAYQKFLIKETDRFDPSVFPQLTECLEQTVEQLGPNPTGPSTAMIVSFVKNHCIDESHAKDYPVLAERISTKSIPLSVMEQLFESSRQNPAFRKDMEEYITAYLSTEKMREPRY